MVYIKISYEEVKFILFFIFSIPETGGFTGISKVENKMNALHEGVYWIVTGGLGSRRSCRENMIAADIRDLF
ncbi:hypothetical protein [Paraclostridium sordellii]|uniref:hypothetical protein n=1 Tax=Paraclostridium sordellii TaxID=1505 RepID=UPI0030CC14B7